MITLLIMALNKPKPLVNAEYPIEIDRKFGAYQLAANTDEQSWLPRQPATSIIFLCILAKLTIMQMQIFATEKQWLTPLKM
jgi:hypothetical protein